MSIERKQSIRKEPYDGDVFCAEVPTHHTLVTRRHGKILISGNCTGNAMAGALMTEPLWVPGRHLTETDAVRLYAQATHLDSIPGSYPSEDTGSSGLAVAKAAKLDRYISGYKHAFGLQHVLEALTRGPGIIGVNWYDSFDAPTSSGECLLSPRAVVRGGHEIQIYAIYTTARYVQCYQSWGPGWGGQHNGTFRFSYDTLDRLLSEQGDAVFPHS